MQGQKNKIRNSITSSGDSDFSILYNIFSYANPKVIYFDQARSTIINRIIVWGIVVVSFVIVLFLFLPLFESSALPDPNSSNVESLSFNNLGDMNYFGISIVFASLFGFLLPLILRLYKTSQLESNQLIQEKLTEHYFRKLNNNIKVNNSRRSNGKKVSAKSK